MRHKLALFFLVILLPAFAVAGLPRTIKAGDEKTDGSGLEKNEGVEGVERVDDFSLPIGLPINIEKPVPAADDRSGSGGSGAVSPKIVYTFELRDDVGPPSWRAAQAAIRQARNVKADVLLIHMNSSNATLETADNIRKGLKDFNKPVLVYFDDHASTTAKIISMGGDSVYMSPKANAGGSNATAKKTETAAGRKNTNTVLAQRNEISRNPKGAAFSEISDFAFNSHVSKQEASSVNEVMQLAGISNYKVVQYTPGFFDRFIDFLLQPFMAFFLLLIIFGTSFAYFHGKAGALSQGLVAFTGLFYIASNYLEGYARIYEILLFIGSVILIIYAGNNFGNRKVIGISGMVLLLSSLLLMRLNNEPIFNLGQFWQAGSLPGASFLVISAIFTSWLAQRVNLLQRCLHIFSPKARNVLPLAVRSRENTSQAAH
ncbi:MAG: hypothetical protein FD123_2320 [Bacteroidetes bacterium]|nr:MAG: hypothetical protein FD123_2320 [Bacteroidota bacterium]